MNQPVHQPSDISHPLSRAVSSRTLVARSQALELSPALVADSRRALWLPHHRMLVVSDLHVGYAWAHRSRGQLLPLSREDDTVERLLELRHDYKPEHIVLLGDIIHGTASLPEVRAELGRLIDSLSNSSQVTLILGNHDHRLEQVLTTLPGHFQLRKSLRVGEFFLLHGDDPAVLNDEGPAGTLIMGHEHPTLSLGDGVTAAARCPAFLFSDRFVVLPAFSSWASGCTVGRQPFLSPLLSHATFAHACAVMGRRLLKVPLA